MKSKRSWQDTGHADGGGSIGQFPSNIMTKYGSVNLTFPDLEGYGCDLAKAECESCKGKVLDVNVTMAVS
jgi:hypothetical protein